MWVLLITVLTNQGVAITNIPNFPNRATCYRAGDTFVAQATTQSRTQWVYRACLEVPVK